MEALVYSLVCLGLFLYEPLSKQALFYLFFSYDSLIAVTLVKISILTPHLGIHSATPVQGQKCTSIGACMELLIPLS